MWDLTFAMSAPRGIELDQDKFVVSDCSLEVVVGEDEDPLLLCDLGLCHGPQNRQHNQELHLLVVFELVRPLPNVGISKLIVKLACHF